MADEVEYWYRYEDHLTAPPLDEWDNVCGPAQVHVTELKFKVLKYTPQGVWVHVPFQGKKWVKREARKRFACPTREEALESFEARKNAQIRILETRIHYARIAISRAQTVSAMHARTGT